MNTVLLAALFLARTAVAATPAERCASLPSLLTDIPGAASSYHAAGESLGFNATASCDGTGHVAMTNTCRLNATVATSSTSRVFVDVLLPDSDAHTGRLLATGNGGFGGCLFYYTMVQGAGLQGMVAVGTNNGHFGDTGAEFPDAPEVLTDYIGRALEVEHDVGTAVAAAYYGTGPANKYYMGCSTGGRQGLWLAQNHPELYDGIVAGAPAADFLHLGGKMAEVMVARGVTGLDQEDQAILTDVDLPVITKAVLDACDALDGVTDGIIDEPSECEFDADVLLCTAAQTAAAGSTRGVCLTAEQVAVVKTIFAPLRDEAGTVVYPGFDYGFTSSAPYMFSLGLGVHFSLEAYRNVVYNDPEWTLANWTLADVALADTLDIAPRIATWNPDISAFKAAGRKMLSYHGTADSIIPSANTLRYRADVKAELGGASLDDFWRHFQIGGLDHCFTSTGGSDAAWNFGQLEADQTGLKQAAEENIMLALIDWVESGKAPASIVGTKFKGDVTANGVVAKRTYCPWPQKSTLKKGGDRTKADAWTCV